MGRMERMESPARMGPPAAFVWRARALQLRLESMMALDAPVLPPEKRVTAISESARGAGWESSGAARPASRRAFHLMMPGPAGALGICLPWVSQKPAAVTGFM